MHLSYCDKPRHLNMKSFSLLPAFLLSIFLISGEAANENETKKVSHHLQDVLDFYKYTTSTLHDIEKALNQQSYLVLNDKIFKYWLEIERVNVRLEVYLHELKTGKKDGSDEDQFVKSINEEVQKLNEEAEKWGIGMKGNEVKSKEDTDKDRIIRNLEKMRKNEQKIQQTYRALEREGIALRTNGKSSNYDNMEFDTSILTKLVQQYKIIEKLEEELNAATKEKLDDSKSNKDITQYNISKQREKIAQFVEKYRSQLKQFMPIIEKMTKKVQALISRQEEEHDMMGDRSLLKTVQIAEAHRRREELLMKIKTQGKARNEL